MTLRNWRRRLATSRLGLFLAVLGPGMITAMADNDATGVLGYSQAGAQYEYGFLWIMILSGIFLAIAQEVCVRMGAVTGRGLADLIREEYGVRITILAMVALLIANFATTIAEFAGMLAAVQVFYGPGARFVVLPIMAAAIWILVVAGSYERVERVLLTASLIYICYIVSAILAHPNWHAVASQIVMPNLQSIHPIRDYVFMAINVIGTTITPWEQFYVQSSVRDKGVRTEGYKTVRLDVIIGSVVMCIVGCFIIICCGATLHAHGVTRITDVGQAAGALVPIAGPLASALFAIGLFNASCLGAVVLPLSTSYAVTEALGWESGVGRRISEAPLFMGVYTFLICASVLVVMAFPKHLANLIILPNIIGAMLLPIILVLMHLLANKRRLMGDHVNTRAQNAASWTLTVILSALSVILVYTTIHP